MIFEFPSQLAKQKVLKSLVSHENRGIESEIVKLEDLFLE